MENESIITVAELENQIFTWCENVLLYGGDFLKCFAECWRRADKSNQAILFAALVQLIAKYPQYLKGR